MGDGIRSNSTHAFFSSHSSWHKVIILQIDEADCCGLRQPTAVDIVQQFENC